MAKDTLNHKLKIDRRLCKAHWHPEPLELAPVGNEGRDIRRGTVGQDIVEASLQVQHGDPLSLPKLCVVLPHVIELELVIHLLT